MRRFIMVFRGTTLGFGLLISALLVSCNQESAEKPLTRFTMLPASDTGIEFSNDVVDNKQANILLYANFYGGGGVGLGDFNNDGLQDLYFAGNQVPDKLYLNQGDLKFEDATENAGITDDGGWSTGVTIADVNNDGYSDIYVSRELYDDKPEWRTNLLYINNGDATFTESAGAYGIAHDGRTRHATFLDYDKDGLLDLFLLTQPPNPGSLSPFKGAELIQPEYALKLYRNLGQGFEDVTAAAGLDLTGFPNGVSASDLNNDGWTDLYVANDFYAPDFMFINQTDGTFKDVADESLGHMSYYSMGVDVVDLNNDALLDIFVLDMVAEDNFRLKSNMSGMDRSAFWEVLEAGGHYQYMYNTVQLNNGNTTFSDVAQYTGMSATDWSWSNLVADFDNNGHKDVYVTNGLLRDIRNTDADQKVAEYINKTRFDWLQKHPDGGNITTAMDIIDLKTALGFMPSQPLKNYAFKNSGGLKFEKVMEDWGLDAESFSNGAAYGDLDNDGDLDIVVNNINQEAFVYRNNTESIPGSNYVRIALSDKENKPVFGARVTLFSQNGSQTVETTNVRGIYSTSEPFVHFGMGDHQAVDSLEVRWPNGTHTLVKNITINGLTKLSSDSGMSFPEKNMREAPTIFKEITSESKLKYTHKENAFDDFEAQVLLPHKMSQFGPAMSVADVNNDGLEDIFLGGASGFAPALYLQQSDGSFIPKDPEFWSKEKPYEDVDAVFADINNDRAMDLFVVSGGNEHPVNNFHYSDRLYLNDGKGNFKKAALLKGARVSGSRALPLDYDEDGDIDIFVAGRHLPHRYPMPASSVLYTNNNGQLENTTAELAPELTDLGMVTDATWLDYDQDGDSDLILVGEWMPITVFVYDQGKLRKTSLPEFDNTSGWWFSITPADFDGDGDMDFVAGNMGLNYKYQTSEGAPFDIYSDDFDANGSQDIVLGYYNNDKHYPLRGFSCSSEQIPGLKKTIKKYDLFASMEIGEVYGTTELENALHYEVKTFASHYVENLGGGRFRLKELPAAAQLTNMNGALIDDFNQDGHLDVLSIGNLFVSEIETPKSDAGVGLLLLGDSEGNFNAEPSLKSGFFVPGDAKQIAGISIKGTPAIVVANNDNSLQIFEWRKQQNANQ